MNLDESIFDAKEDRFGKGFQNIIFILNIEIPFTIS